MKDQLQTIREALEFHLLHFEAVHALLLQLGNPDFCALRDKLKESVAAVAQLEAMVGEQKPVGEAEAMPGTSGFTMAVFKTVDVPVGTELYAAPVAQQPQAEAVPSDTERLNWIEREYVQVDTFSMPTGAGDADVGWTFKEWYEGEREPRLIYRHYKDDLRAAIDAAIAAAKKEAGHE